MMKMRLILILSIVIMITAITSCSSKALEAADLNTLPEVFRDGTYSSIGEADAYGWIPEVTIKVEGNKITAVHYDEFSSTKKSLDTEYHKSFTAASGLSYPSLIQAMEDSLIKSQDVSGVDAIAGATKAFESFKALAVKALKSSVGSDNKLIDGVYEAKGTEDNKGWVPQIKITIENQRITAVDYDEASSRVFIYKSQYGSYLESFTEATQLELLSAIDTLKQSLIENQTPLKVDAVAGATQTSKSFIELSKKTLIKSR